MQTQGFVTQADLDARDSSPARMRLGEHTRKLRIAHVNLHVDYLPGIARTRADEARAAARLDDVDWSVWVMSPDRRYATDGVRWAPLRMPAALHNNIEQNDSEAFFRARALTGNFLWRRIQFNRLVNRLSRDHDYVIVRYNSADLLAWSILKRKHKLIFYPHNKPEQELAVYSRLGAMVERLTGARQYSGALAVAAESPEIAQHEARRVRPALPVIDFPNGVFVDDAEPLRDERDGVLKLAMVCSEFQVWQGLDLVLDRLETYDGDTSFELHLVGNLSDEMRDRVDRLPNVTAHGYMQRDELDDLLARMDLGVSSMAVFRKNISQLNALKTRAYLAAGLPVIQSYDDPAFPEGFPYVHRLHQRDWTWREAIALAQQARETARETVREAATPYIDFRHILRHVVSQFEQMTDGRRPHVMMTLEHDFLSPVVDRRVEKEALRLLDSGWRVTVLCWSTLEPGQHERSLEHRGVRVVRMFSSRRGSTVGKVCALVAQQARTAAMLRRLRPEVVHCHDAKPLPASTLGARLSGARLVYDSHEVNPCRDGHPLELRAYAIFERLCLPHCDHVFTANEPRLRYMVRQYPHTVILATALHNVPTLGEAPPDRTPAQCVRLLYQGVVSKARGVDNLLRALAQVEGAELTLVGPARPGADRFEQLVDELDLRERVTLLPIAPIEQVFALMRNADVGIVSVRPTSVNNRLCAPNKLYDYMRSGLAVLAPDFPHMRREIADCGHACDFGSVESIVAALRWFVEHRDELPAMQRAARTRHETLRNWEREGDKLIAAYRRLR